MTVPAMAGAPGDDAEQSEPADAGSFVAERRDDRQALAEVVQPDADRHHQREAMA